MDGLSASMKTRSNGGVLCQHRQRVDAPGPARSHSIGDVRAFEIGPRDLGVIRVEPPASRLVRPVQRPRKPDRAVAAERTDFQDARRLAAYGPADEEVCRAPASRAIAGSPAASLAREAAFRASSSCTSKPVTYSSTASHRDSSITALWRKRFPPHCRAGRGALRCSCSRSGCDQVDTVHPREALLVAARTGAPPVRGKGFPPSWFDRPLRTFFRPVLQRTSGTWEEGHVSTRRPSDFTLDSLRKEAKRWLKALRANDADARGRYAAPCLTGQRRRHCVTCNTRSRASSASPDGRL